MTETLITKLLNQFTDIRYVAIYSGNKLISRQRSDLIDSSSSDSDRYEELLVNPALLTLARQRGNIDCGGLRFIVVAYGNFYQLLKEIQGGHISICLEKNCQLSLIVEKILFVLEEYFKE